MRTFPGKNSQKNLVVLSGSILALGVVISWTFYGLFGHHLIETL